MDPVFEKELESILNEEIEKDDVTMKDHLYLLVIGFVPFILATLWYVSN